MNLDAQLRSTLQAIHTPTAVEATAIIDVARLAAAADRKTDLSETVVLLALTRIVCELAGMAEMPETTAIDPARLAAIGEQLVPMGARELAYACAYLVMIQDLDLTKEEAQMASSLAEAMEMPAARAQELATQMETLIRTARSK